MLFSIENDAFILVALSAISVLGIKQGYTLSSLFQWLYPGLLLYDDVYPKTLRGTNSDGSELILNVSILASDWFRHLS